MKNSFYYTKFLLIFGISLVLLLNACKRPEVNAPILFTNSKMVVASISGQVFDEYGDPLATATVEVGTATFITDNDGVFFFRNISVKENAQLIKITKDGYFHAYRTLHIIEAKDNFTRIAVMKKDNAQTFDATQAKTIIAANGATINFSANSIVTKQSNQNYNGTVTVFAKTIRSNNDNIAQLTPGALRGIATDGSEKGLTTFGMLGVELQDANGNALQIAPGKTAEIIMPIAADQQANAPVTIPLWHFDEAKAMWVEEGSATKVGTEYRGTVGHFSFWNCDLPWNFVWLRGKFRNSAGNDGIAGCLVVITSSRSGFGHGFTNSMGEIEGAVPMNENLVISLMESACNKILSQTTAITTTAVSKDIGSIDVNFLNQNFEVAGSVVNCNNAPLINAPVILKISKQIFLVATDSFGNFRWTGFGCASPSIIKISAFDYATAESGSVTKTINYGLNNVGTVAACGTLLENIMYTLTSASNSLTFSYVYPTSQFFTTPHGANTVFTAQDSVGSPIYNLMSLKFDGNQTAGNHNIYFFNQQYYIGSSLKYIKSDASTIVPISISEFGATLGSSIKGSINGSFLDTVSNETFTINGSFNMVRDFN